MGKGSAGKRYIDISGFDIHQPNRGNAALSYGAVGFLLEKGLLSDGQELIRYRPFANIFRKRNRGIRRTELLVNGKKLIHNRVPVFVLEKYLVEKLGIILPFTRFGRSVRHIAFEAADYGGDGFSDIYGDRDFRRRMNQTFLLRRARVPLILLPQTIGPFKKEENYRLAVEILKYAQEIYVRDGKFKEDFEKLGLKYTQTKDLSFYMQPEPWNIAIEERAVGLNVSGLAYSNTFHGLEGQFDAYPELVDRIIDHFRRKGCTVYLIPHSYTYNRPDDNDDMAACREAYRRLADKRRVILVDKDLTAPQVKYVISRMTFFIGARMHANFAAIYTGVPVFGMAYSYKFEGAFEANGLDGAEQTERMNYLTRKGIDGYIKKIDRFYTRSVHE